MNFVVCTFLAQTNLIITFGLVRRNLSIAILIIMTVHQAGRLGVFSFLYENKAKIAFTLGIIAELPVALCSSDYNADQSLVVFSAEDHESVPPVTIVTRDLNPFICSLFELSIPERNQLSAYLFISNTGRILPGTIQDLLRPPSIG
jgi:hypothetical protein